MPQIPRAEPMPVPAGWRLRRDPALRVLDDGGTLLGGVPLRLFRLGPRAARHVESWLSGSPVVDRPRARALARRLLDAGLVHPDPVARPDGGVTIVVPVHDRPAELARCLTALGTGYPVVVVDDGSGEPEAVAAVASAAGARLVRRTTSGGPGAARNEGLRAAGTPFVSFVDSDCVPPEGWIDRLLPHLDDPAVAVAAPRIVGLGEPRGGISAYEHAFSPLDLGREHAAVLPGTRVPYVPATALVVRVDALGDGFDPALRTGEDVDLCWRLASAGWTIRYDPGVEVAHEHRTSLGPWLRTRIAYDGVTAELAARHPGVLHAAHVSRWSAAAWTALALGRPAWGAGAIGVATALLHRRLGRSAEGSARLATDVVLRGALRDGASLARALRGPWLPVVGAMGLGSRRARRVAAHAVLTAPLLEWAARRPPVGPLTMVAGRLLDDVAGGLGIWRGCVSRRVFAPLLPRVGAAAGRRD